MLLTEEEAKEKLCLHIQVKETKDGIRQCFASHCMAWHWACHGHSTRNPNIHNEECYGYCGLATVTPYD